MNPPEATGLAAWRLPLIGAAVAVLLILLAGLAGAKSLRDLASSHERERSLETRIGETRHRIDGLRNRIVRLRTDPGLLERLAREELGFVRPKDVIIELPVAAPPATPVADAAPLLPLGTSVTVEETEPRKPSARREKPPAPIVLPPSDAPPLPE